jgi:hypothetical protein
MGGVLGSISLVMLAQLLFPTLRSSPDKPATQSELLAQRLITIAGSQIGSKSAELVISPGVEKFLARDVLQGICQEKNASACGLDFTASLWSPCFWINRNDSVRLSGVWNGSLFESECDVMKLNETHRNLVCGEPTMITGLRLKPN